MELGIRLADEAPRVLKVLYCPGVGAMQGIEFGACPMHADDVAGLACRFGEIVPDVDIVRAGPTLPLQHHLGNLILTIFGQRGCVEH